MRKSAFAGGEKKKYEEVRGDDTIAATGATIRGGIKDRELTVHHWPKLLRFAGHQLGRLTRSLHACIPMSTTILSVF